MGPILIFDKSVLESLNPDEAMWLDNFFLCNITPLFFAETLADLEKEVRAGRTPDQVVGSLAYKTPDSSSKCNVYHRTLLVGELLGNEEVEMTYGRPIISGGRMVKLGGETGVIFQQSPEEEAFKRWQNREFLDLERFLAKKWRSNLSSINLKDSRDIFSLFLLDSKPKNFLELKKLIDFYIDGPNQEAILLFGLSLLGVPEQSQKLVFSRWSQVGRPTVRKFAPYFAHVFSVDLFFYTAIAADLIGHDRPSNRIDIAYLYYLPFCMVFTSNDKLHISIVPLFLRDNQTFITGTELKVDLAGLDEHYNALPDEIKERGVVSFASYPPLDSKFLVTRLWDKHMSPTWRKNPVDFKPQPNSKLSNELLEKIRRITEEGEPVPDSDRVSSDKTDHMIIERKVYGQKGKWKRFPPEVLNRRKNEEGEWEDIDL